MKDTQQSANSTTRAVALHRPLVVLAALTAMLAVGLLPVMVVDHRQLLGVSVWLKPWKFAVSITLYALTVAWMVTLVDRGARLARRAATVAAKNPTHSSRSAARAGNICWEAQKPSKINRMPASRPSHQVPLISLAAIEVMMSSVPGRQAAAPAPRPAPRRR
jgi:hypothetical protein